MFDPIQTVDTCADIFFNISIKSAKAQSDIWAKELLSDNVAGSFFAFEDTVGKAEKRKDVKTTAIARHPAMMSGLFQWEKI